MDETKSSLSGRVAMVTGGGRGIGRAVADGLAARGAAVAIVTPNEESGKAAEAEMRGAGGNVRWVHGDITSYACLQEAAAQVMQTLGPMDILVASGASGGSRLRPFLDTDPKDYGEYFFRAAVMRLQTLRAAVDQMISKGKGKVVFLTTEAGRMPTTSEALHGAAAAGLIFATRALGRELARYGIRINTVTTTLTRDTPAFRRFEDNMHRGSNEAIVKAFSKIESRSPFGMNKPQDVANMVLFFCGDESDQISGATIGVNGGLSFP